MVSRFDVYLVDLNPTQDSEMYKTRPALVVSPDEMNGHFKTVIVAPMTRNEKITPTRVQCHFAGKNGQIALDQVRCVDKTRLVKHLGKIDASYRVQALDVLQLMFKEK